MLNPELFLAFLLITMVLIVTPGPIVTLVIATGATQGIRPALLTVLGTVFGNGLLVASIAFGLSWLLKSSAPLFETIRWLGVAYLVWLGVQAWRSAGRQGELTPPPTRVHLWRGFLVALSNPKTIAFFTAFLPQFVDPALPVEVQLAVMCTVSVAMAAILDSAWAIAAGLGRGWFVQRARARLLGRASGTVLIAGGIWLALTRRPA
jgi:homoserine/homoserine lactone efflux protein